MQTNPVVVQAEEAVDASVAAFTAVLAGSGFAVSGAVSLAPGRAEAPAGVDDDPLRRAADGALDVLAGVARCEAKLAALKVQAVAVLTDAEAVDETDLAVVRDFAGAGVPIIRGDARGQVLETVES